ncbi:MAG: cell division protein ZapA [Ignavibacteria bacterium]|nr:cell division protein ZapA [Ignavibacteria bacterium]
MKNSGIKVRIFNSNYYLQGDNPELVENIAGYVDSVMQRINFESPNQSDETIAVVAALNIAENYYLERERKFQSQQEYFDFLNDCTQKIDEISRLIDKNI